MDETTLLYTAVATTSQMHLTAIVVRMGAGH